MCIRDRFTWAQKLMNSHLYLLHGTKRKKSNEKTKNRGAQKKRSVIKTVESVFRPEWSLWKVYETGRSWAGSKREREISDMDGESGELTQWENVVGAWTGKRDRGTGMRLTERTKKLLPETWWGIPIKERSVIRKAVNWLSVCSYDYMLRQYKVNRGSQMYNLTGRSIVFSEATVLKSTEAAASVASNVATALVMIVIHMVEFNNLITTNCMLGLTGIPVFKLIFFA